MLALAPSLRRCTTHLRVTLPHNQLHTSPVLGGKRNFKKFLMGPHRGTGDFRALYRNQKKFRKRFPDINLDLFGDRPLGLWEGDKFEKIPEMIPEIVVPDLSDCKLKPYVSYQAPEVTRDEFTARSLFYTVYSDKIMDDFKEGRLDSDGEPTQPSEHETMEPEQARQRARAVHSDIMETKPTIY